MSRRSRSAFNTSDMALWLPFVAAGQDMDRRFRTRHIKKPEPPQPPHDVINNDEYPFGRGGVYEVPMRRHDDGA